MILSIINHRLMMKLFFYQFQSTTLATSQRNRVRAVLQEVSKDILKVVEMCLMPIPNGK